MPFARKKLRSLGVFFATLAFIWLLGGVRLPAAAALAFQTAMVSPTAAAPPPSSELASPTSAATAAPSTGAAPTPPTVAAPSVVAPGTGAVHYDELLVSVSLNGVGVTDNTMVLKDDRGSYYAGADDVRAWRLVQNERRSIEYNGQRYFVLDDFKVSFDANRGLLALIAPPSVFGLNVVNFQDIVQAPPVHPTFESGGFLNYDIAHHFGTQGEGFSGSFNGAHTVLGGIATASAVQPGNGSGFVRLNTAFERDNLPAHTVLRFGDAVEAGGVLSQQRQFGGVQWGTDFALTPSFTTTATPVFSGALPTEGTLDILVNGRQVSQQQIPAGPFMLQNVPLPQGGGNVTLVLRNASGQVQTIVSPYYETPLLLRQGVSQFEFDAGSVRRGYGSVSNSYDGAFAAVQGRRGVSNHLTLGGAIDESAHVQSESLAAVYLVPAIGQVAATITGRTGLDPGLQQTYTYSYSGQHFTLGGQLMKSSPLFRNDACQMPCQATNYQLTENVFVPAGKGWSSFSLSYAHSITTDGSPSRSARLTYGGLSFSYSQSNATDGTSSRTTELAYGRALGHGRLDIDMLRSSGQFGTTTIAAATFSLRIGARGYGSVSAVKGKGESGQRLSYSQALPSTPTGFAYQLVADTSASAGATLSGGAILQLENATVSQQFLHDQYSTLVSTDIAGSIDFVDHAVSFARTIDQGFGVVELPGYRGIPVFVNGLEVGRTDAHGRLILTQVQPYAANEITLGAQGLPIGTELRASVANIAPLGLSPGIARFVVKSAGGVSLTLVDSQGAELPVGTKVVSADGKLHWIVAFDGQAYLEGVAPGKQRFSAMMSTAACSFELAIPKDTTQLPDLGRTVCR